MPRLAFLLAATLVATPAFAATYSAKPAAPVEGKIIGRDISWACGPAACSGNTDASRPVVLCQDLAKRAGSIESFIVDGSALSADDLAKCNKYAKNGAPAVLATAN